MKIKYNASEYKELRPEQLKVIKDYDMKQKSRGNGENTRDVHVRFLMRFARLVKKPFDEVTDKDISKFLAQNISQGTGQQKCLLLKQDVDCRCWFQTLSYIGRHIGQTNCWELL